MHRNRALAAWVAAALCFASLASRADVTSYFISDDAEFTFLGIGPMAAPGAVKGTALIDDIGNGAPTLIKLELEVKWTRTLAGAALDAVSGVPGTSVAIDFDSAIGPAPNQTGAGSTGTLILWGTLVNWAQAGGLSCTTTCPGGCPGATPCGVVFGFEGAGPPPPLTLNSINTDPWTFFASAFNFSGPVAGVLFWFIPGSVHFAGTAWLSGVQTSVPGVGIWGASALAGTLLAVGGVRIWRRRREGAEWVA